MFAECCVFDVGFSAKLAAEATPVRPVQPQRSSVRISLCCHLSEESLLAEREHRPLPLAVCFLHVQVRFLKCSQKVCPLYNLLRLELFIIHKLELFKIKPDLKLLTSVY